MCENHIYFFSSIYSWCGASAPWATRHTVPCCLEVHDDGQCWDSYFLKVHIIFYLQLKYRPLPRNTEKPYNFYNPYHGRQMTGSAGPLL